MEDQCPHRKFIRAGDETSSVCTLVDKMCLVEHGYECEEWEIIKKEWESEQR